MGIAATMGATIRDHDSLCRGNGKLTQEQAKIKYLKEENKHLKMEKDMLYQFLFLTSYCVAFLIFSSGVKTPRNSQLLLVISPLIDAIKAYS